MPAHIHKQDHNHWQGEEFLPKNSYSLFDPMIFPNSSLAKKKSRKKKSIAQSIKH